MNRRNRYICTSVFSSRMSDGSGAVAHNAFHAHKLLSMACIPQSGMRQGHAAMHTHVPWQIQTLPSQTSACIRLLVSPKMPRRRVR